MLLVCMFSSSTCASSGAFLKAGTTFGTCGGGGRFTPSTTWSGGEVVGGLGTGRGRGLFFGPPNTSGFLTNRLAPEKSVSGGVLAG